MDTIKIEDMTEEEYQAFLDRLLPNTPYELQISVITLAAHLIESGANNGWSIGMDNGDRAIEVHVQYRDGHSITRLMQKAHAVCEEALDWMQHFADDPDGDVAQLLMAKLMAVVNNVIVEAPAGEEAS